MRFLQNPIVVSPPNHLRDGSAHTIFTEPLDSSAILVSKRTNSVVREKMNA